MFAWLLLYVYVLGDVLDFVIVLFLNSVLKYILHIFFVSAWMLFHGYFRVDVLGFVVALFQSSVFEHVYVFAWWFLYVYVFGDVLDFVILLFQSGVFKYILVCSGWGGGGGGCCACSQNVLIYVEKTVSGGYMRHRYPDTGMRDLYMGGTISATGRAHTLLHEDVG